MRIYTCKRSFESLITCIYDALHSRLGHQNIKIEYEPIGQYDFFNEYVHVESDERKFTSLSNDIISGISSSFYNELLFEFMAYEEDVPDNIYRMVILGLAYGEQVLDMMQYRDVMRHSLIKRRLGNEIHSFIEFVRFNEIQTSFYISHIEPKSFLITALGEHFMDRMPSENWMIIDDVHHDCIIHPKDKEFYYRVLSDNEYERLLDTENHNDEYTDLWKVFFESISIKQRSNYVCQRNHIPLWQRKHAPEFH